VPSGRNWDKHNREARVVAARQRESSRSSVRKTFEALAFYYGANEHDGGNYVVLPVRWEMLSDADLHSRRIAHRKRSCAENKQWFDYAAGDRWVRVRDETVEALDIQNCELCASFVRRN
jgi:hypothetical protein